MKKKIIVGLTGNIASGKSTVATIIKEKGLPVIDADRIGWKILKRKNIKREIIKAFGDIQKDGKIDRKRLGNIVFSDKKKLEKLNAIVHPLLLQEIKKTIEQLKENIIVVNAALIFEWGIEKWFDKIILVESDKERKMMRLVKNGFSEEEAMQRINSQIDDSKKVQKSDYIITNNGTLGGLKKKTLATIRKIMRQF